MKHRIEIKGLGEIDRAAREFLKEIGNNTLVAFYAPMGAGKPPSQRQFARRWAWKKML